MIYFEVLDILLYTMVVFYIQQIVAEVRTGTYQVYKYARISSVGYPQIYIGGSYPLFLPYRGLL